MAVGMGEISGGPDLGIQRGLRIVFGALEFATAGYPVRLTDAWSHRKLVLGSSAQRPLSAAARVMVEHLLVPSSSAGQAPAVP